MEIDPRGPRLSAVITTIVLAVVLITGSAWLLAAQVAVFAVGAQAMGLVIAGVGVICLAAGATAAGLVFTALALAAAFLNAAFDLCLGCHVYLFIQRNLRVRPSA